MAKRKRQSAPEDDEANGLGTSSVRLKSKGLGSSDEDINETMPLPDDIVETPSKRRRGRPPGSANKPATTASRIPSNGSTPSEPKGKVLFSVRRESEDSRNKRGSPKNSLRPFDARKRAGKKGVKNRRDIFATKSVSDEGEEEEEEEEEEREEGEDLLVGQIRDEEEANDDSSEEDPMSDGRADSPSNTPSRKRSRKRHRKKSPTPPQDLPAHERYFWQNRPGKVKTSNNTLSSLSLLTHEQYHDQISSYEDPHAKAYETLYRIHTHSFPQWLFELSQDFNICLYGYGSKRRLVTEFAQYLHEHLPSIPQILVVNGYNTATNLRNVLTMLATLVYDCKPSTLPANLGSQPRDILTTLLAHLTAHPPVQPINIFINSLDAQPLRRPSTSALLAQLAVHPSIHMLATCDTPNFPLLWDVSLREQFNWLFHDTTTFQSYGGVEILNVIDEVNELIGRSGRSVKGKGGAGFVLRSLPENARSLYRVLIAEILTSAADGDGEGKEREELGGVERKALYQKVVEEFICSSEMGFGQLLNEFFDHDMLVEKRDEEGTKVLGVPWRREECEEIIEELMG